MQQNEKAVTAKLVICRARRELQQLPIDRRTMRIGRRLHNDIVLDDLTVSGDHATIDTDLHGGSTVRDLGSRNGTLVNGKPTDSRRLMHDDVIEIGVYQLRYVVEPKLTGATRIDDAARAAPATGDRLPPAASSTAGWDQPRVPTPAVAADSVDEAAARLCWLSGPNSGRQLLLTQSINRVGDAHVAVIAQRRTGWSITHLEGLGRPLINGVPIAPGPHPLVHDDMIELGGTMLRFQLGR